MNIVLDTKLENLLATLDIRFKDNDPLKGLLFCYYAHNLAYA